jgi:hypothetical protein
MSTRRSLAILLLALCAQLAWSAYRPVLQDRQRHLPQAASVDVLRVASGGDELALSRLLLLWLQAFDAGPDGGLPLAALDYHALRSWLGAAADLDARSRYPLLAASQVYAAVEDPVRVRVMLDFVRERFLREPDRHWPWLAHAALTARHRLHDLPLALQYARELRSHTAPGTLPLWATQLEAWFAQDLNELDSARALIGGLIASGRIRDPGELRLLERRLQELERNAP